LTQLVASCPRQRIEARHVNLPCMMDPNPTLSTIGAMLRAIRQAIARPAGRKTWESKRSDSDDDSRSTQEPARQNH
jgi:antitoxin (DNA-binding transcriptional repressor) of toxin-antitoxin stability system